MTAQQQDTRARIMTEAESLFRHYGYAKTTVADIARRCGMSPANVYRFFASKSAINEAICRAHLAECEALARRIARQDTTADARLRALVAEIHATHRERFTKARKLHEMVVAAMDEHWGAIDAYRATLRAIIVSVIAEGMDSGVFVQGDAEAQGRIVFNALTKFFHPAMIAQNADVDLAAEAVEMVEFILRGLKGGV